MKKRKYNGRHYYTDEETEWLKKECFGKTMVELSEAFNSHFGVDLRQNALKCYVNKLHLKLGKKSKYTPEVHEYIRHCYCNLKMTGVETVKEVNRRFGEGTFSDREMHNYISYHRITNNMGGRPTSSMFKKGHKPSNHLPKGTVVFQTTKTTNRVQKLIKVDDKDGWMLYNHWLWQQHHGPVPEDHVLISLSRSDDVTDVNDLICVKRTDAAKNYKKMQADKAEYNHNAVLITQLERLIKEKGNGNK